VVYDYTGVMIISKDRQLTSKICDYALTKGYENARYISENELIEGIWRLS
jgi:hypothetical protein